MTPTEILTAARALIVDKRNWCTGKLWKRHPNSDDGMQHCARGALITISSPACARLGQYRKAGELLDSACVRLFDVGRGSPAGTPTINVNDTLGHSAIILAFDVAIGDLPAHAIQERALETVQDDPGAMVPR